MGHPLGIADVQVHEYRSHAWVQSCALRWCRTLPSWEHARQLQRCRAGPWRAAAAAASSSMHHFPCELSASASRIVSFTILVTCERDRSLSSENQAKPDGSKADGRAVRRRTTSMLKQVIWPTQRHEAASKYFRRHRPLLFPRVNASFRTSVANSWSTGFLSASQWRVLHVHQEAQGIEVMSGFESVAVSGCLRGASTVGIKGGGRMRQRAQQALSRPPNPSPQAHQSALD